MENSRATRGLDLPLRSIGPAKVEAAMAVGAFAIGIGEFAIKRLIVAADAELTQLPKFRGPKRLLSNVLALYEKSASEGQARQKQARNGQGRVRRYVL